MDDLGDQAWACVWDCGIWGGDFGPRDGIARGVFDEELEERRHGVEEENQGCARDDEEDYQTATHGGRCVAVP